MITIESDIPPPVRLNLSDIIRGLEVDQSAYFPPEAASIDSVRSIVTKVKGEFEGARAYVTAREADGVRVWRIPLGEVSQARGRTDGSSEAAQ